MVRFYGLHRVKLPREKKIHFVIMGNIFPPNKDIHCVYDLKVSSQDKSRILRYTTREAIKKDRLII
jgi:hypothetical protein